MTVALEIKNVSHNFGKFTALDDVSLNINSGDFTVLLGLNGAGKTTLYSLITRLYNNNSGSIKIYGFDVRENPVNALKNIGVVFQQPTLDLDLSVKENLEYHSSLHGISSEEANKRIDNEIGRIKLDEKIKSKVRSLSGGQRRRVEIARCLCMDPDFILLDEPFAGVDPIAVEEIQGIVHSLKQKEIGVLITDHNVRETLSITDRSYLLFDGQILKSGSSEFLANDEEARRLYLGEKFKLD